MNNSNVSLASDSSALVSKDELKVRIEKVRRGKKEKNRKEIVRNTLFDRTNSLQIDNVLI